MLFEPLGPAGQKRLKHARTTLVGCGALGSVLAETLVRAGVGSLRLIDRDFVELSNLQRQVLFDEHDVAEHLPKAEAAARKLRRINSSVEVEALVVDLNPSNAESLCEHADLLLDGSDNFETRFLLNDVSHKLRIPWIYGACIAAEGLVLPILPGTTACLRCIWEDAPPPGMSPTCDTAGVLGPAVQVVASLQAVEALKWLSGREEEVSRRLITIDVWNGRLRSLDVQSARAGGCACCGRGEYDWLSGRRGAAGTVLCGRDAVQILPPAGLQVDLRALAGRFRGGPAPVLTPYLLRLSVDEFTITLFPDGRAIVQGTSDVVRARSAYAKWVGA